MERSYAFLRVLQEGQSCAYNKIISLSLTRINYKKPLLEKAGAKLVGFNKKAAFIATTNFRNGGKHREKA